MWASGPRLSWKTSVLLALDTLSNWLLLYFRILSLKCWNFVTIDGAGMSLGRPWLLTPSPVFWVEPSTGAISSDGLIDTGLSVLASHSLVKWRLLCVRTLSLRGLEFVPSTGTATSHKGLVTRSSLPWLNYSVDMRSLGSSIRSLESTRDRGDIKDGARFVETMQLMTACVVSFQALTRQAFFAEVVIKSTG